MGRFKTPGQRLRQIYAGTSLHRTCNFGDSGDCDWVSDTPWPRPQGSGGGLTTPAGNDRRPPVSLFRHLGLKVFCLCRSGRYLQHRKEHGIYNSSSRNFRQSVGIPGWHCFSGNSGSHKEIYMDILMSRIFYKLVEIPGRNIHISSARNFHKFVLG